MGRISLAGGAIGFVEQAPAGGGRVPIILLHGVGSTKAAWAAQLDHFGPSRRTIALDYPGYGESAPRDGVGRDGFAAAMVEAMDALNIDRAHLCGLSLGGVVAIAIHHAAPDRCASLILADSFAYHPEGEAIYERSVAASRAMTMRALAEARAPSLLGAASSETMLRDVVDTMATIDRGAYRQGSDAVWLADQRERAAAIRAPTLILCGDEDKITPVALSRDLAAIIPHSRLNIIADAGHLSNIEQADQFNAAIDQFLTDLEKNL